jgi:NAD(P)-dependent dehydrogenase (short-subunit alcohol dehydrogenase family)
MIILLTGSTSGIGLETLKGLYSIASKIILPVRSLSKANALIKQFKEPLKIDLVEMDLENLESVNRAATAIASKYPIIDLLINNAGGMYPSDKKTIDGLSATFQVNHLGHFLLIKKLLPNLILADGKIIQISSEAHRIASVSEDDIGLLKSPNTVHAYANAKLFNILVSRYLTNHFKSDGLSSYSLHPGAVRTSFGKDSNLFLKAIIRATQLFFISPKAGAETTIFLGKTEKTHLINGAYYAGKRIKSPSSKALNNALAEKIWIYSEQILAEKGYL